MAESLNAGFELDDEDHYSVDPEISVQRLENDDVFEDPVPGEVPEMKEETDLIATMESSLEDLFYLQDDLRKAGGMCQAFAQEAQRLIPGFDKGNPIGFYTKVPTATRYKVALEGIVSGIWEAIKKGIAALIEMVKKFFRWLSGGKTEAKAADVKKEAKEQVESIEEKQEDLDRLAESAKKIMEEFNKNGGKIKTEKDGEEELGSFDQLIQKAIQNTRHGEEIQMFLESRDPLFHDITNHGKYTQAIERLVNPMRQVQATIRAKLQIIDEVYKSDISQTDQATEMVNTKDMAKISGRIEISYDGKMMYLDAALDSIQQTLREVKQETPTKNLSFDRVFSATAEAYSRGPIKKLLEQYGLMAEEFEHLLKTLDLLQDAVGSVATDDAEGAPKGDTGKQLRAVIAAVGQDLSDLRKMFAEIQAYRNVLEHVGANCASFAYRISNVIYRMKQTSKTENASPDAIKELKEESERIRREHWKHVKPVVDNPA